MAGWQEKASAKKAAQEALIPKDWRLQHPPSDPQLNVLDVPRTCGILNDKELEITELNDVAELAYNLQTGRWSALEVTVAYCKRAAIAQQLVNCLTEIMFDEAIAQAKALDEHFQKTGETVGPLHGVPISLKDQIALKGVELSMGYVGWLGNFSEQDAVLAAILRKAGAVFYVRTNVPQTLMCGETINNIFGRTLNPANRKLTSGGSSGGEGALIALKGSPLGVGSDIGGSIRIPAGFNGLYGLRPTNNRTPYEGSANSLLGLEAVSSVLGPLSRSLSGLTLFMKTVIDARPWTMDPKVPEIPWRTDALTLKHLDGGSKLTFGLMRWDEVLMPHPPVLRAIEMTRRALLANGHEVVDFAPLEHARGSDIVTRIYSCDGGEDIQRTLNLSGEPLVDALPVDLAGRHLTTYESWQLNQERDSYRRRYLEHWEATAAKTSTGRLDALIAPMAPSAAPAHKQFDYVFYTAIWNLLDYPACVFPVTSVDPTVDVRSSAYAPVSKADEEHAARFEPNKFAGAPIGLQVVGRRYREEELLGMTKVVSDALRAM